MIRPYIPKVNLGEIARALPDKETPVTEPIITPVDIQNPESYLTVPDTNLLIAKYEPDWTKGANYKDTAVKVFEKGLKIPPPSEFMKHFLNVVNAYHNISKLYDGSGNIVQGKELEDIYKHLTTNHINNGAWSWLNGRFVSGSGFKELDLETIIGIDKKGDLVTHKEPLEECIWEDCFVELEFNRQGLAIKKSKIQKYIQGENLKFWYPRGEEAVAGFNADGDRAFLYCGRNPDDSSSALGVFVSAEGTPKKI